MYLIDDTIRTCIGIIEAVRQKGPDIMGGAIVRASIITITLDTGKELEFYAKDLYVDNFRNYHIRKQEGKNSTTKLASIERVIFNPPATIVFWSDGTKTVVKCCKDDIFDPEKGLAMAICKRAGDNKAAYYKDISRWCKGIPVVKTKKIVTMDRTEAIKVIESMKIDCNNALARFDDSLDMTAFVASISIKLDLVRAVIEQMN